MDAERILEVIESKEFHDMYEKEYGEDNKDTMTREEMLEWIKRHFFFFDYDY